MQSETTFSPTYYNSNYLHGVDEKRRIQIPAKWRPAESGTEFTLIVWPGNPAGACLRVLPPEQMANLMRDLNAMPNSDPNKLVLKRFIGSKSVQAPLDKAGRICLPEAMMKEAGITKEAMLVGTLDRFEIWSPEIYKRVDSSDSVMANEAFKLMG